MPGGPVQLEGYAAASNVRGTVFLETIGINAADLTQDIIILDCFYLGLVSGDTSFKSTKAAAASDTAGLRLLAGLLLVRRRR